MSAEHTPGPWSFDHDWHRLPSIMANGLLIATCPKLGSPNRNSRTVEQEANACLIAASPDLLEALEAMTALAVREYSYLAHEGTPESAVLKQARAAIAKAKGGAA